MSWEERNARVERCVMVTRCQRIFPFSWRQFRHWVIRVTSNPGPWTSNHYWSGKLISHVEEKSRGVIGMAGSICSLRRTNTRFSRRKPRKEHSYPDTCRRLSLLHHQLCSLLPFYQTHFFLIVVCVTRCQWRLTPLSRQIGLTI